MGDSCTLFEQGFAAYPSANCPYLDSDFRRIWFRGWADASAKSKTIQINKITVQTPFYEQGYGAYNKGSLYCGHDKNSWEKSEWQRGWNAAREDNFKKMDKEADAFTRGRLAKKGEICPFPQDNWRYRYWVEGNKRSDF